MGGIDWQGNFIWLLCVSKDEGLRFELARTIDGEEEMRAIFVDRELTGADDLRHALSQSELWPVYKLRAIVILQQRVFDQLQILYSTQEEVEAVLHGDASSVREAPYQQAMKLRSLEFELLEKAYEEFERQVSPFLHWDLVICEVMRADGCRARMYHHTEGIKLKCWTLMVIRLTF